MQNTAGQKFIKFLFVFDIFMSVSALIVDRGDFANVPFYLWPFTPICPLYPLLLAICFLYRLKRNRFPKLLTNFTAVGITSYGILAIIFYPLYMLENSFRWYEFGNILWVLLYSLQFILFLPLPKINVLNYIPIAAYFFTKDILDRYSETFSYQRYKILSENLSSTLFICAIITHLIVIATLIARSYYKNTSYCNNTAKL